MAQAILQKSVVPLVGGLDRISPRFAVDPGTLQDSLNYETYGVAGYSVMEGLARYDGAYPCFNRDWVVATRETGSGNFTIGEYLRVGANYFGVTLAWDSSAGVLEYLIINPFYAPRVGDTILGATAQTLTAGTGGIKRASLYYTDETSFLAAQKAIYESARTNKKSIYLNTSDYSRNVIPHGLHWYRGSLYAIADAYQITFDTGAVETLPGDQFSLVGAKVATVLSVNVTSGAWSDGDAAGTMVVRTDGFTTVNSVSLASTTIRRPNGASAFTTFANAFTVTDRLVPNSPFAQLFQGPLDDDYQTTEQINTNASRPGKLWKPVDMGWQIGFATDDDTTGDAPSTVFRGEFLSDVLTNTQSVEAVPTNQVLSSGGTLTNPMGAKTTTSPAATALSTVLGDASTATYVQIQELLVQGTYNSTTATLNDFDLSTIPDGAIISGIALEVTSQTGGSDTLIQNWSIVGDVLTSFGATPQTKNISQTNVTSATATALGGESDLWGMTGLTSANLIQALRDDPTFGFKFDMSLTNDVTGNGSGRVHDISLTVYYKTPVTQYYAHDTVTGQDLQIEIPYYRLTKGQFNPGVSQLLWGEGSMAVYSITPLDAQGTSPASSTWTIGTGWELRTAREGGGTLIAKFTSQMEPATLPARATMDKVRKRFGIITANYYANADWVAMYGVSGVGPSWQYDGYYFYNAYTELPLSEDTPSHICYHRGYAVLGYENSQCIVSVPGEPTNFSSVDGATLYPFGNRITGLLSLNGTALGVFCESSIHALAGDILTATDDNNAVSQTISPYSGAIEYTVVDCGIPLFADFRGISTIDATNKYGDFENGRVSYRISPFLSERVNSRFAYQATAQNILFALPVRNKNQYRLYFADGAILTCGLPIETRGYEFTIQKYSDSTNLDCLVPVAMCSGTSRAGRDLLFGTFKILPDDDTNIVTPTEPDREMYVYEVDKGYRFDLAPIKHFARLNYMSIDEPNDYNQVKTIRLELLTYHYFNGYVSMSSDYQEPLNIRQPIELEPTGASVRIEKDSDYMIVNTEGIGTTLAIEIGGEHIYPGHTLQAMLVYTASGRDNLGTAPNQKVV